MTLDERAARAAADLRNAVPIEPDMLEFRSRLDRRKHRGRRYTLMAVVALTVVATGVATLMARNGFGADDRPPEAAGVGRILFGRWDARLQQSHWFTISPDGTNEQSLHVTATCASWFPDGSRVLLTDDARTQQGQPLRPATVRPDGSDLRRLDAAAAPHLNLGCGDVSPSGSQIVLEGFGDRRRSHNGIYSVRASDGADLRRLTQNSAGGSDSDPRFAPDGHRIVFLRTIPGTTPEGAGALFVTSADRQATPQRITPWGYAFLGYSWSPDGHWIAFQRPYGQLYIVHPDGTGLRRIPLDLPPGDGAQNPAWSPDGKQIAFSLSSKGQANIYTARLDGSDLRRVTSGQGAEEQTPDWTR
jgi:Tol biopolymer transport system component